VRDYDTDYRYADVINRRARWGVLVVVALLLGVAWAGTANQDDGPPPSVLAGQLLVSPLPVGASSTTSIPRSTTTLRAVASTNAAVTTSTVPATTTTQPTTTTTVRAPRTTTSTTTTTTTVPPTTTTTTVPPTTTTTIPPTTTTTTTVPPTTTTTIATRGTIHIHDLKGDAKGGDDEPYARIEVQIRNDKGRNQRGVLVTGRFSDGLVGVVAGTTSNKGTVIFESGIVDTDSITFTVIDLAHPDYTYDPDANRRGPSVTVEFD
jgi:hypothetical protein